MCYQENEILIFEKERSLWEAIVKRDIPSFKELVDEKAVMICGGGQNGSARSL